MSDGNNAITMAQLTEQINEKMDRDAGNATLEIMRTGVIEYQHPTEENGWIWYRKYKDGWVEQGGFSSDISTVSEVRTFTYPVPLSKVGYAHASIVYPTTTTGTALYQYVLPMEVTNTYLKSSIASGWQHTWYVVGKM